MGVRQDTAQESLQERWLADFLDWYDAQQQNDGSFVASDIGVEELVDAFLKAVGGEIQSPAPLREALMSLAGDMLPAKRLASEALTYWLSPSAGDDRSPESDQEVLPRQFGDYELVHRIGHGGMGVVYRAEQKSLGRTVCIKMLPSGLLEPGRMRRFTGESRLAGRLHHPAIVPVFDAGSYDGQPYYVMELVEGETLAERIAREPLPARQAAAWLCEIAAAVQFAHDAGVLHRDLKPANVLIDAGGRVRVTDFGLARHIDDSSMETGVAGTPSYMAAEQVRGQPASLRTDVYAMGAVLYEMLSGRPPHVGNSPAETMRLVIEKPPIRLTQLRPGTPRDLETICHRCLEQNPQRRYESAGALRDDVLRFLRNEPVLARPIGRVARGLRWTQRHPAVATAAAVSFLSVVLLLVGGAFALWKTQAALKRTRTAEATQRRLASQLSMAKEASDAALYRSLIVQTVRSLETLDVESARRSLEQIDGLLDFDGARPLEYRLLYRQAYPEVATLAVDGARVRDAGWTGDGTAMVALLDDGRLGHFDQDGVLKARTSPCASARAFAVHPNRPLVATADGEGNLWIWNVLPLELRSQLVGTPARHIQWHPVRSELVGLSDDGGIWRVAIETGEVTALALVPARPGQLAISPDGRWLAVATQNNDILAMTLPETQTAQESANEQPEQPLVQIAKTAEWVVDLAWADAVGDEVPRLAAVDERGTVTAWSVQVRSEAGIPRVQEIASIPSGPPGIASLDWDGKELIVGHAAGQVSVLDVEEAVVRWKHPCQPLRKIVSQPQGDHCLLLHDGTRAPALWNLNELGIGVPVYGSRIPLRSITTGDSGQFAAWRDIEGQIGMVSPHNEDDVTKIVESAAGASGLAASPIRPLLAVTRGTDIVVYRVPSLETVTRFSLHQSTIWLLAFSSDGKWLASGDGAGSIGIQCVADAEKSRLLATLEGEVRAIAFSPEGNQLAAVDNSGRVSLWGLPKGTRIEPFAMDGVTAHSLAYVDDSQLAIGDSTGRIHQINLSKKSQMRTWKAHEGPVWSILAIGPRLVSAGQEGTICISDAAGNIYHRTPKQSAAVWSLTYDKSSGYLWAATVSGQALRWQTRLATEQ